METSLYSYVSTIKIAVFFLNVETNIVSTFSSLYRDVSDCFHIPESTE